MRILIAAALAAGLTGAAYAGPANEERKPPCDRAEHTARVDGERIAQIVERALARAEAAMEQSAAARARAEARVRVVTARIDAESAERAIAAAHVQERVAEALRNAQISVERAQLSEADQARIQARVDEAMARVARAMENMDVDDDEDLEGGEPKSLRLEGGPVL